MTRLVVVALVGGLPGTLLTNTFERPPSSTTEVVVTRTAAPLAGPTWTSPPCWPGWSRRW
ncbi:MAG: hypothetical protein IVW52_15405 [Acidimicrobiales bacterium]|nr:hypothetical protein [Acidimicrobiales bacterium]